ncbi:hypothetical protein AKJ09_03788 [Labilithrix luteola]|uniref:Uncharacterized protein n=1 Tax=Labilithrix luteola TaxID=1391654 RepID=A0A0K1PVH0_9BACT|nr:hypothetical protein AKJ09_03788 [Labilithrix luteola]
MWRRIPSRGPPPPPRRRRDRTGHHGPMLRPRASWSSKADEVRNGDPAPRAGALVAMGRA